MAITFDNAQFTATTGAANSRTLLLTATAGAVLLVFTTVPNTQSVSAINVGANALTRLGTVNYRADYGEWRSELWGLTAPATGTLTISAHLTPGSPGWGMLGVTYVGQRTTATPFGGVNVSSSTATGSTKLIISSTSTNQAVFFFGADEVPLSQGTGLTKRLAASNWAGMLAADAPGALAITGSCTSGIGTVFGNIGINLIASTGAATITGSMSATDAPDTFAATAKVRVSTRLSATDAADTFAATAKNRISARLSATDAVDTFAAVAKNRISARLSATEAFSDTFAATAANRVTTRLSATDAQDVFAATATTTANARTAVLSATDAQDAFAATIGTRISARLSATETTSDTFAASANARITTRLSATDAQDTFAAIASVPYIHASMSAVDAPDVFAASVTVIPVSGAAVVVPVTDPGAGHGKKRNRNLKPPYIQATNDFWDARERYLESLQPEISTEPSPEISPEIPAIAESELTQYDPGQLVTYSIKRTELIAALPSATTMRQLRSFGDELRKINRLILRQKQMAQLIERVAREERRDRRIKRLRRTLATLEQARKLLSLYNSQ